MKSLRNLRIPLIVLAALCLLFLLYYQLIFKNHANSKETTSEASEALLLSLPIDDIRSVTVNNVNGDSFTISSNETTSESRQWLFEGPNGLSSELAYSQSLLESFVTSFANISSVSKIETDQTSLAEYGLEPPDYFVKIILNSGQEYQLFIGNYSIEKDNIYIKKNDSDDIYLASSNLRSLCEYTNTEFLDTQVISIRFDEVLSFSFKRKTDPINVMLSPLLLDIDLATTFSQWEFVSPLSFLASNKMSGFIESILDLSIYRFLNSDSKIEDYGLNDPEYSFIIKKADGTEVELYLSKLNGDYFYGFTNLSPNIFMVSKDSLSGLQIPLIEQISPEMYSEDISVIKSIEARFPEGSFLLEMDLEDDEHFLSEKAEIYVNKRNAKVSDSAGNSYFEVLYKSISRLRLAEIELEQDPKNMKTVSFKILKKDGSSIIIDYSEKDNESYFVFINDIYNGFVINKSEIYGKVGTTYPEYGIWDAYELLNDALDGQINGKYDISEP